MRRGAAAVVIVASLLSAGQGSASDAGAPAYLTIQFGRTQWSTGAHCVALPRTVDLGRVAEAMTARGLVGTGGVVVSRTPETGIGCFNHYALQASWQWMHRMQRRHGWGFVSQSRTYRRLPTLSYPEQVAESCGTIPEFQSRGITGSSALFAYPANEWTEDIQTDPVSRCFAYGRRYLSNVPNVRSEMSAPWFARTTSVNGGRCSNPALPCHTLTGPGGSPVGGYSSPVAIANLMATPPDTWFSVQVYRFVRGTYQGDTFSWDCRSEDWRNHWTSNDELYCWQDAMRILNAGGAALASGVIPATPAQVARAWGRLPRSTG